jgi:hypothetical protein
VAVCYTSVTGRWRRCRLEQTQVLTLREEMRQRQIDRFLELARIDMTDQCSAFESIFGGGEA